MYSDFSILAIHWRSGYRSLLNLVEEAMSASPSSESPTASKDNQDDPTSIAHTTEQSFAQPVSHPLLTHESPRSPTPTRFHVGSTISQQIYDEYALGYSSPPATLTMPCEPHMADIDLPRDMCIQNLAHGGSGDIAQDTALLDEHAAFMPSEATEDYVWSEPARVNWTPGVEALDTVADLVARPQSCNSTLQLKLVENWKGQAELTFESNGSALSRPEYEHLTQLAVCFEHDDTQSSTQIDNSISSSSQEDSPDVLVKQLKRNVASLFSGSLKKPRNIDNVGEVNTDTFLDSEALDLSESSLPGAPSPSCASENNETQVEDSLHPLSQSQVDLADSSPPPSPSSSPHLQAASEVKLTDADIDFFVYLALEDANYGPHSVTPIFKLIAKETTRVDMLRNIEINEDVLTKPVRGQMKCGRNCAKLSQTLLDFAAHLDEAHGRDHRPIKCPHQTCAWNVLGFHQLSQCTRHVNTQHTPHTFRCAVCRFEKKKDSVEFSRADALRRHLRDRHGVGEAGQPRGSCR